MRSKADHSTKRASERRKARRVDKVALAKLVTMGVENAEKLKGTTTRLDDAKCERAARS